MEWVEILRGKLRELRVLAPKENLYTKMPEPRHVLLPTRDPTSPLPLPPIGDTGIVPGVERPPRTGSALVQSVQTDVASFNSNSEITQSASVAGNAETVVVSGPSRASNSNVRRRENGIFTNDLSEALDSVITDAQPIENNDVRGPVPCVVVVNNNSELNPTESNENPNSNITVIAVASPSSHYEPLFVPDAATNNIPSLDDISCNGLIPRLPSKASGEGRKMKSRSNDRKANSQRSVDPRSPSSSHQSSSNSEPHASIVHINKESLECNAVLTSVPASGISVVTVESIPVDETPVDCTANSSTRDPVPPIPAAFQPAPNGLDVKDIPLIGGRRRRRSSSSDAGPSSRGLGGADLIRLASVEVPEAVTDGPRLTLRETQVCQLKREIAHPGGVRLPLRRKDCAGSIALVDISNAVW